MITINEKGVFARKITVSRHGDNASNNTLKNVFIKSAEKYTVNVQSFVTNTVPPLWRGEKIFFQIQPKGAQNAAFPTLMPPNHSLSPYLELRLSNIHSVSQVLVEMEQFFYRFNLKYSQYLKNVADGHTTVTGDRKSLGNDFGYHVMVGCDANGVLQLLFSSQFLTTFYLKIPAKDLLGLRSPLWASTGGGALITAESPGYSLIAMGQGNVTFAHSQLCNQAVAFRGSRSVFLLDSRLSLDVTCTIPHSNIITSTNSKEEHDHILARFDLSDYLDNSGGNRMRNDLLMTTLTFNDKLQVGPTDLVKGAKHFQAVSLLPGTIHSINTALFVRYIEDGEINSYPLTVNETEFWRMVLVFTKKTT